jgi:hypothetical protein
MRKKGANLKIQICRHLSLFTASYFFYYCSDNSCTAPASSEEQIQTNFFSQFYAFFNAEKNWDSSEPVICRETEADKYIRIP